MSAISKIKGLFSSIFDAAGRFLGTLFQTELEVQNNINSIVDDFQVAQANIKAEIAKLKSFDFDPKWKSRVINVPVAIKQSTQLVETVADGFRDKFQDFVDPIKSFKLVFQSEASADPLGDKPSGLAKTATKIGHIAEMIAEIAKAMHDIKDMTEIFKDVTDSLEGLDSIFLQQGNPQKLVDVQSRKRIRG